MRGRPARLPDVPLSDAVLDAAKDAARYDFEPDVPFGVPFRPTPFRATFALSIAGADVRSSARSSTATAICSRARSGWSCRSCLRSTSACPATSPSSRRRRAAPAASRGRRAGAQRATVEVTVSNNQKGAVDRDGVTAAARRLAGDAGVGAGDNSSARTKTATVKFTRDAAGHASAGRLRRRARRSPPARRDLRPGYQVVEYPHIHRRHVVEPAQTRVKVIDVRIAPGLKVGYIMGVGDQVPAAIEQLGADVHLIDAAELASGDLSRTTSSSPACAPTSAGRICARTTAGCSRYVENGGTVIVQYNKQEFNQAQYGPYPGEDGTDRMTDENAPVDVLVPDSPGLQHAQQDRAETWAGWVQERGTYFLAERDPRYVDLSARRIPFPYNAGRKDAARWSRRATARDGGSTSAWASGASCRPAPKARTSCWRIC